MNERDIEKLLAQDPSAGTEAFREELLSRCLAVLDTDESALVATWGDASVLSDEVLDMLAAAGDPALWNQPPGFNNLGFLESR